MATDKHFPVISLCGQNSKTTDKSIFKSMKGGGKLKLETY